MSTDGTFRVEVDYAPTSSDDQNPWRYRIIRNDEDLTWLESGWGSTRDDAVARARAWIKVQLEHGEPEVLYLDRNGDPMPRSLRVAT